MKDDNGQTIILMQNILTQQRGNPDMIKNIGKMMLQLNHQMENLIGLGMVQHCMQTAFIEVSEDKEEIQDKYEEICKKYKLNPYPTTKEEEPT
jgi:hypothetical protein